jgi:hypothetical protein
MARGSVRDEVLQRGAMCPVDPDVAPLGACAITPRDDGDACS